MDDISHNWFYAQNHCLGRGLTIEEDINDQPHWTGVYRRLSPWINILGQYLLVFCYMYHQYVFFFNATGWLKNKEIWNPTYAFM